MTSTILLTNTDTNPNYDYVFELTGPSGYVLNQSFPLNSIPDEIDLILKINDTSGNTVATYNLNDMGVFMIFNNPGGVTLGDIASGNIVPGYITDINFYGISIEPDYGGDFNANIYFTLTSSDVVITFSDIPQPAPVSTGTIIFNMEGRLYNDLEAFYAANPAYVSSIVQSALLSIFNISNVTIQSLQFNSIDVDYTSTGTDFDATNFEINMSDSTNIVNAFVDASNSVLGSTYTAADVTLTGVNSTGEITDSDGNVIAFSCFAAGSMVETDQGKIAIEKINKNKHTINGKKIVALTKNILGGKEIVSIKKDALGKNMPSQNTLVSPNHLISYQGEMKEAKWIAKNVAGASFVPYQKEVLYNILMEQYDEMKVNNMVTETLHPNNLVAKLHRDYTFLERQKLINEFNKSVKENGYNTAKKMFKKRI